MQEMVVVDATETVDATEGDVSATYPLPKTVDLPSGDTLSVPIVDAQVKAERVAVFRPGAGGSHPVSALKIRNETSASLPPGIVTVYDEREGYVGDARLPAMAAGAERMASFATDRKVDVSSAERPEQAITQVTVSDGMLRATQRTRAVVTYTVRGAPDGPRKVVIEHPARDGWTFSSSARVEGEVPGFHRIVADVASGATATINATHEMTNVETVGIADANEDMLLHWTDGVTDPKVAEKLRKLAEAKATLASAERDIREVDAQVDRIGTDQGRIRENLKAVPAQSELAASYVAQMREQEQELAVLSKRRKELDETIRRQRGAVGAVVRSF